MFIQESLWRRMVSFPSGAATQAAEIPTSSAPRTDPVARFIASITTLCVKMATTAAKPSLSYSETIVRFFVSNDTSDKSRFHERSRSGRKFMIRFALISIVLPAALCAASWADLPLAYGLNQVDRASVEKEFKSVHPWQPGAALPRSFKDAGLASPVTLVACDIYLDGGSHFYLFRGANGKFLALCTDSGSYYSEEKKQSVPVDHPRLFLAAFHFGDKNRVTVPFESPTERFLLTAIKSEVARIAAEKEK